MKKVILLIGDIVLLYASLAITVWLRYGYLDGQIFVRHLIPFSIVFIIWLMIFFINGLYEMKKVRNDFKFYGQLVQNLAINALLGFALFYSILGQFTTLRPQKVLIVLLIIFAILFLLWRKIFYKRVSSATLGTNLAIIGINEESLILAQEIMTKPQLGYKLKLFINPDQARLPDKFLVVPMARDISELKNNLLKHKISTVVVLNNPKYGPEVAKHLFESIDLKVQYFNLVSFYEKVLGKMPLNSLERSWFLENFNNKNFKWNKIVKKTIDLLFAGLFSLVSLVLLPFIALSIKLESKGPLIYSQERVGLNGKIFTVYKFRSMVKNAETNGAQWAKENDARVTRVGKFIRKTRIDEIPQFWNILKGDMSFVGPRPERPEFVSELKEKITFYDERHLVKPGLSGWAQINFPYGASVEDAKEKLSYDLFYIKNQSVALDISTILKTFNTVFNKSLGR